jgi:PAS domain S-box-containing protein
MKIKLSLSIMILGYLIWMIIGHFRSNETLSQLNLVKTNIFPAFEQSTLALAKFNEQLKLYKDAVVFGKKELLEEAKTRGNESLEATIFLQEVNGNDKKKKKEIQLLVEQLKNFIINAHTIYSQMANGQENEATLKEASKMSHVLENIRERLNTLKEMFSNSLKDELSDVGNEMQFQRNLNVFVFFLMASLSSFAVLKVISRLVIRPLKQAAALASAMAEGDLTRKLDIQQDDEIGELAHAMNVMADKIEESYKLLEQKVAELSRINYAVNSASDAIGMMNNDLVHFYQNKAFTELLGYTINQLNKAGGAQAIIPDKKKFEEMYKSAINGTPWIGEVDAQSRTGEIIPIFLRIHPIKDNTGSVVGLMKIFTDIRERKKAETELAETNRKLFETARIIGKTEEAGLVLHNVGNVLNNFNITVNMMTKKIQQLKIPNFVKAVDMIEANMNNLGDFITKDAKGREIPGYLSALAKYLTREQESLTTMLRSICEQSRHIMELIKTHLHNTSAGITEMLSLSELLENTILAYTAGFSNYGIEVKKYFNQIPPVRLDRHKFLQIFLNLLNNAKYALKTSRNETKILEVHLLGNENESFQVKISDNGIGIAKVNLDKIFNLGFTTRKGGFGLGLHSAAIYAKEMGGSITVYSDGPEKGAVFTIELPLLLK